MSRTVRILGTHGVPAAYGGFETAAENVGRYLVRKGWRVIVYCQTKGSGPITEDVWEGIERINIPIDLPSWRGTWKFDHISVKHASRFNDMCLTFGYNTAIYNLRQKLRRIPNVINMDGIEWSRKRWNFALKAVLYLNERIGCLLGDDLIADHPVIAEYLKTRAPARKITTIAYGAIASRDLPSTALAQYGLSPGRYFTLIARAVAENNILEIVRAFSSKRRGFDLVVLGSYGETDTYERAVRASASEEVKFLGSIYNTGFVSVLRYHCIAYFHGHTVGGTNPSLVEALAADNPVIAQDNPYNRWVAGDAAVYFSDEADFCKKLDEFLSSPEKAEEMSHAARNRFDSEFTWDHIAGQYETLLLKHVR